METQRAILWCKLLDKQVEVILGLEPRAAHLPGVPEGWEVKSCLGRDTACYHSGCPFTVEEDVRESTQWPFRRYG